MDETGTQTRTETTEGILMGQLQITRRIGESVQIGDDITVTVIKNRHGSQVRLAIDAPESVNIVRTELLTEGAQPAGGRSTTRHAGERDT